MADTIANATRLSDSTSLIASPASLAAALSSLLLAYFTYNLYFHPLASLPGPLSARLGLPYFRIRWAFANKYLSSSRAAHARYGLTVRLGPNFVSTVDPGAVRTIYSAGKSYLKSNFYDAFKFAANIFTERDPDVHGRLKRTFAATWSAKTIAGLEPFMDPVILQLLDHLDAKISHGSLPSVQPSSAEIDLSSWLRFFASDVIGELGFGQDLGLMKNGDPEGYLEIISAQTLVGGVTGTVPQIAPYVSKLMFALMGVDITVASTVPLQMVMKRYNAFTELRTSGKLPEDALLNSDRLDMLQYFLNTKYSDTKQYLGLPDVFMNAMILLNAGGDTTSFALNGIMYSLLTNPDKLAIVQKEVDEAFENGSMTYQMSGDAAGKLPYLQAVIKEALRIYPASGMELPRLVPSEGLVLRGGLHGDREFTLPYGTEVGVTPAVLQTHEAAFGPDAKDFKPERWLDRTADEKVELEKSILTFGGGSRICLGRHIALLEISKVMPILLRRYSFHAIDRSPTSPHRYKYGRQMDGTESRNILWYAKPGLLPKIQDFWVEISRRTHDDLPAL